MRSCSNALLFEQHFSNHQEALITTASCFLKKINSKKCPAIYKLLTTTTTTTNGLLRMLHRDRLSTAFELAHSACDKIRSKKDKSIHISNVKTTTFTRPQAMTKTRRRKIGSLYQRSSLLFSKIPPAYRNVQMYVHRHM